MEMERESDTRVEGSYNETSEDLAEMNMASPEAREPENMCASTEATKRGYTKLAYRGMDEQFQLMGSSDGGFLGRPQGWER